MAIQNSILTIDMITRAAVALFKNTNLFIQNIDTQYDNSFVVDGAKIGDTLRIRLPSDFTTRTGPGLSVQGDAEQSTTLTLQTQMGVDVSFSTAERTLKMDDYAERVLAPMMNNLAGATALNVMQDAEGSISNLVTATDGSGNIIHPTAQTFLNANAMMMDNSAPMMPGWKAILNQWTNAAIVNSLQGQFNPATTISEQYRSGMIKNGLGFDFFVDQTVINHTSGTFSAGTVNLAGQSGTTINLNAITGTLKRGDIISFDAVNAVNRVFKASTGRLQQFVVTADVASGGTSVSIYPALVPPVGGQNVQYQTVDASPANLANVTLATPAGVTYRKNFTYSPRAVTLAMADLVLPRGVHEAARRQQDGISVRMITDYIMGTDQLATRLDIIFGKKWLRGEWGVIVADTTSITS